jgi:hypothetical protein
MDNLPTGTRLPLLPLLSATKNRGGKFYLKSLSSNERDGRHFTANGPLSKARPGSDSQSYACRAFIPSLFAPPSPPHVSTLPRGLDLSHAATGPTPRELPSLLSHAYAASARPTKLIDIAADEDFEESTLLEMATSHDKYQAAIEVAIYDKIQIELNGRPVSTGDHSENKHGVDALKSMLQELLKHRPAILTMAEIVSVMGGLKRDMYNHLVTVFPQKLAMSKIKKTGMTENYVKIWKVFRLVWFHPEIKEQRDPIGASDLDGIITMMNAVYSRCKVAVHSERDDNSNGQSMKMPAADKFCGYLQNGATLPEEEEDQRCPSCSECCMHEPTENIEICARNAEETRKW